MSNRTQFHAASAILSGVSLAGAVHGQFTGIFAPSTWTITIDPPGSGGSAVFAADGSALTITGGDSGIEGNIDVTHRSPSLFLFQCDWTYSSIDTSAGFDEAYFLHNGAAYFMSDVSSSRSPDSGCLSVPIGAGDIFGWRIHTVDGIFGPGHLTLNGFPLTPQPPSPGALPLLGIACIVGRRRR